LYRWLGDDPTEDRSAAVGRADPGSRAGVVAKISIGLFEEHVGRAHFGVVLAVAGHRNRSRQRTHQLLDAVQESLRGARAGRSGRGVVGGGGGGGCSSGGGRGGGGRVGATGGGKPAAGAPPPLPPPNAARRKASTFGLGCALSPGR